MRASVGPEHLRDFERRRSLRFVLPSQEDVVLTHDGRQYHGKLEDVSIGGAKLRFDNELPQADTVQFAHAEAGTIDGTCEWRDGVSIGVSFELTDPALKLISLCLRQGVPSGSNAA